MKVSELDIQQVTRKQVDQIIYEGIEYSGESAPYALVLGNPKAHMYRLPKAVEVYKAGKTEKILLSGGAKWNYTADDAYSVAEQFPGGEMSEADRMKYTALRMGVDPEDIWEDQVSMTTIENMLCSMVTLEQTVRLHNVKEILLVTSTAHMRRSLGLAKTFLPSWIRVIPCPAEENDTRRDNWWETEDSSRRVYKEVELIITYIQRGLLEDFEI